MVSQVVQFRFTLILTWCNVTRFINIQTKQIILSRDIQWLNSFWKEYKKRRDDSKKLVDEFYSHEEDDQTQDES